MDGGGSRTTNFNVGQALIAPFLWQRRIRQVDAVIISHPDNDHFNGLPFIMARFHPQTLWINGQPGDRLYNMLLSRAKEKNIRIIIPEKNLLLWEKDDARLVNITGLHQESETLGLNDNDRSLIIKLVTGNGSFIFPGDIEKRGEKIAVVNNYDLNADIMLAPHHGSRTSSSEIFLQAVDPGEIVISAASRKSGIFPAEQVVNRYRAHDISVLSTAVNGTVTYRITADRTIRETYNTRRR